MPMLKIGVRLTFLKRGNAELLACCSPDMARTLRLSKSFRVRKPPLRSPDCLLTLVFISNQA